MEIPQFDPNEKPAMTLKPVDRSKDLAALRKVEADKRLGEAANEANKAERAQRAAEPREAAQRAFDKTVDASMEKVARAKSPEDLLDALDGVDVKSLDEVQANALRFRLNQMVPAETGGRPRTKTEMAILQKILGKADGNAEILEGAAAEMRRRAASEVVKAAMEAATAPGSSDLRGVRTVIPGTRPPTEKRQDPGVFDRFLKQARNRFGL